MSEHWMITYTGRRLYPAKLEPFEVSLTDVAHALSRICRFGGHTPRHYSVAQHAVVVSEVAEFLGGTLMEQWHGLHHDDAEYVTGDMIWPLKHSPGMEGFKLIERGAEEAIARRFGMDLHMPGLVKHADLVALAMEKRDVMKYTGDGVDIEREEASADLGAWHCDAVVPHSTRILPVEAFDAKVMYLKRHQHLCSQPGFTGTP
jgi:uncharacterized protein